jgi:hypothetical protein
MTSILPRSTGHSLCRSRLPKFPTGVSQLRLQSFLRVSCSLLAILDVMHHAAQEIKDSVEHKYCSASIGIGFPRHRTIYPLNLEALAPSAHSLELHQSQTNHAQSTMASQRRPHYLAQISPVRPYFLTYHNLQATPPAGWFTQTQTIG